MAIDRAPWNTLIDDDGSNTTGSIWNKAAIKTVLLDPIDADPVWVTMPHNPANFRSAGGDSWYVPTAIQKYSIKGKAATVWISVTGSQNFLTSYFLGVIGWPFTFKPIYDTAFLPCITSHTPAGGVGLSLVIVTGNYLDFRRSNFSDWPVTGTDLFLTFTGTFEIT
jgi:hypothetical protein